MLISDKSDPVLSKNAPQQLFLFPFQEHILQINVFCTDECLIFKKKKL